MNGVMAGMFMTIMGVALGCAPAMAGTANLVLNGNAMTSAGIYDDADRLVRTLWSGREQRGGAMTIAWDGRDDDGAPVERSGNYRARVLAHNVRYVWEGVIGNTSRDSEGEHVFRAFGTVNDMAIDAQGNAFYVVGYNEQQKALHRFSTSDPRRTTWLAHDDYLRVFRYAATDGALAYFANIGGAREPENFVVALQVSNGKEHRFAQGRLVMPGQNWGNRWESVLDYGREARLAPSGLAVQQRGSRLFIAHRGANEIRVLDKRSGASLETISVVEPTDMEVAPDDSLWVLCRAAGKRIAVRYQLRGSEWIMAGQVTEGLMDPVAIGVSPLDGTVLIADSGTEQLRAFDPGGRQLWTLGRAGGYRSGGPEVATDRFWLGAGPTYIAFEADGSFWFADPGNFRNLHFSARQAYLGQIMYLPKSYISAIDPVNPTRVFRHFLEFRVDYSQPLKESWVLVRNWAAGMDSRYFGDLDGLRSVLTLDNGRTYGVLNRRDASTGEVVELTAAGLRPTGARVEIGVKMYRDGSLRMHRVQLGSLQVYARKLTGFDSEGDPEWAAPTLLGRISRLDDGDPYFHDVPLISGANEATFPQTSDGTLISFDPGRSVGFHLGGIKPGSDRWQWRTSHSGSWEIDKDGNLLSPRGTYELGRGVQYLGNVVMTAGRNIIYGYHGEAWNGGQANQWMHYFDNGLFVGQFGRPVYPAANQAQARPETAGNAFNPSLVSVGGKLYLWHNDESAHGGIHRWRIDNTDSVRMYEAAIVP